MELITGENDIGRRLDRILRKALPDLSLPLIHRLFRKKKILINGKPGKAKDRLDNAAVISIPFLNNESEKLRAKEIKYSSHIIDKQNIESLEICTIKYKNKESLWQDSGFIAFNKPSGIATHGPGSLEMLVQSFLKDKISPSLSFKPGPLHRLDKSTSGVIVFSANLKGARFFSSLLHDLKVRKTYLAIVEGNIEKDEIWQDDLIRDKKMKKTFVSKMETTPVGKIAITKIIPLAAKENYSLVKVEITTGRTHQIRAQAAAHGYPLAGDVKYGGHKIINNNLPDTSLRKKPHKKEKSKFFLHAWKVDFLEYSIEAPIPDDFLSFLTKKFPKNFDF